MQDDDQKPEEVEQGAQRGRAAPRTEKLTSPRVI
jgi:hypothetical protein